MELLPEWKGCKRPQHKVLEGQYARLEPLDVNVHLDDLYEASTAPGADDRFRYLWDVPPTSKEEYRAWMISAQNTEDVLHFAIRDKATGKVGGRQGFHRIVEDHGVAEIAHVMYGPLISRRTAATEAVYLFAKHVFDELGYRRLEWKCNNGNVASRKAALRFGFTQEGLFRQHWVMKGASRDTAWFSIINKDWPKIREAFEKWLAPENFDERGVQKKRLEEFRVSI